RLRRTEVRSQYISSGIQICCLPKLLIIATTMNSRRKFIKIAALLGAGAVMTSVPIHNILANNVRKRGKTAVCIGAGFAGLAATYRLKQNGWDVIVLESRNRIGGRVFSHRFHQNHTIELGAEWVGASHTRMIELCDQ